MYKSFQCSEPLRRLIIGAVAAVVLLASGCSAIRLGYSQASQLAYWRLDGYVDFNDSQSPKVREDLNALLAWHRRTQLPEYAALLARAQAEVMLPQSAAQLCRWGDEVAAQFDVSFEQALPALSEFVVTLTPAQINHLQRQYAKANQKSAKEYAQPDPAERLKGSIERASERALMLYGSLNEAQKAQIARSVAASPFDAPLWQQERRARQDDVLRTLRRVQQLAQTDKARAMEEAQAGLRALVAHWRRSPREPYRAVQQRANEHNCQLAADVHQLSTSAQRQKAAGKFKGWEDDARVLATAAP